MSANEHLIETIRRFDPTAFISYPEPDIFIAVVNVSPELAEELLKANAHNRKISNSRVASLAEQMTTGGWRKNYEPVRFDRYEKLLDAQHRLTAIIRSKTTQRLLIVGGLAEDTMSTIDVGKKRTMNDFLQFKGEKYTTALAATLRLAYLYKRSGDVHGGPPIPYDSLYGLFEEHPEDFREVAQTATRIALSRGTIGTGTIGACLYLFRQGGPQAREDADTFFNMFESGINVTPDSAVHRLIRALEKNKLQRRRNERLNMALVIKAWNLYVEHGNHPTSKTLIWRSGGSKPEAFPAIVSADA